MRRDVFQGIADPTRRAILQLVARQSLTLNAVAAHFRVSRPAISRHMRILAECGLVVVRKEGRERYCAACPEALQPVAGWVDQYRVFWTGKLDALEQHLLQEPPAQKTPRKK